MSFSATGSLLLGGRTRPTSCLLLFPRIFSDRSRMPVVCVLDSLRISLVLRFLSFLMYARGRVIVVFSLAPVLFCSRLFSQSSRARFMCGENTSRVRVSPMVFSCVSFLVLSVLFYIGFPSLYALEALVPICLLSVPYCRFLPSNVGVHRGLGGFFACFGRVLPCGTPMCRYCIRCLGVP